MSEPENLAAKLDRVGRVIERRAELRAVDAERIRDGARIEDDDLAAARAEGVAAVRGSLWRREIPERFHRATLGDWTGDVLDALTDWSTNPDGRNLVLLGPVGTGKTHAAIAACRAAHDAGLDVEYWPTARLLDVLRPSGPEQVEIRDVVDVDRLILDDLGVERPTDWTAERLNLVIDGRWAERRPTVITTNLPADALRDRLGERNYDRLTGDAVALRLTGTSRRKATR